jgi:hypothetical protein
MRIVDCGSKGGSGPCCRTEAQQEQCRDDRMVVAGMDSFTGHQGSALPLPKSVSRWVGAGRRVPPGGPLVEHRRGGQRPGQRPMTRLRLAGSAVRGAMCFPGRRVGPRWVSRPPCSGPSFVSASAKSAQEHICVDASESGDAGVVMEDPPEATEETEYAEEFLWRCSERVPGAGKSIECTRDESTSCTGHLREAR